MLTIHKFGPLGPREQMRISIPKGAQIIHFAEQSGYLYFWAYIETHNDLIEREFEVFGTGWVIPYDGICHGTVLSGPFVWHLIEKT